ncbi:MAG: hypothetical protein KGL00_07145 [Gammaproteobacteria bacterium]|nr:hypothetical protein [Gammaproteobacteria bacterium]
MKIKIRNPLAWCAGLLSMAIYLTAFAATPSAFVNSRSEPHAVLYLNYKMVPRRVYPVRIWLVDGKLTNRSDQGVVWIKPGDYTLRIKLTRVVNLDYVPGLKQKLPDARQMQDLKLALQAGKAYYIGAKFDASGNWQPVVWKTEELK